MPAEPANSSPRRAADAGFGLGRLHHVFSRVERERIVLGAMDAGLRHFDVAPAYGDGLVERELGRILGSRRGEVSITTKFGIPFRAIGELPAPVYTALRAVGKATRRSFGARYDRRDFSPRVVADSLDASLRRLRSDFVDCLLVHEPLAPGEFRAMGDTWDELGRQQKMGKIRRYGVSSLTPMLLDAERAGLVPDAGVRMVPMDDVSCALPESWFAGREVFVFNIVKHLRRKLSAPSSAPGTSVAGAGGGRIDTRTLVGAFVQAMPHARPIFATHNPAEIKRLGEALAAVDRPRQAGGGAP